MSSKIILRIAAGIMLFHGLVLVIGAVYMLLTGQNPTEGIPSEMADFYIGASFCGQLLVLLIAALLWTLSCRNDKSAFKMLWIVATATVLLGIIEIVYFFPYIVCILPGALAFVALLKLNKQKSQ